MSSFAEASNAFNGPLNWQIADYEKALSNPGKLRFPVNYLTCTESLPSDESIGNSLVSGKPDNVTTWSQSSYSQKYFSEESSVSSRSSSHRSLEEVQFPSHRHEALC